LRIRIAEHVHEINQVLKLRTRNAERRTPSAGN
jgi:hypothetical protein